MLLTRFWKNRHGGVAPMVGLAIIPLLGAVGAAVDYSRANATRTAFQAALDSTALMLSKTAALQTPEQSADRRDRRLQRPVCRPDAKNVAVSVHYSTVSGSTLTLNGSAIINTNFLSVLGIDTINITASTTSTWGNTRLRVALVLDNTGSMAQSGQDDRAEDRLAQSAHPIAERGDPRRRLRLDRSVQQGRQCRSQQLQPVLAALGLVGSRQRHVQQYDVHRPKAPARRTAKSGRQQPTTPGTAASPTATRITTPPTTLRSPAPRSIRPSSMPPARRR